MNRKQRCQTDTDLVASAANDRGASEFDIFKAAHVAWFNRSVNDREIEHFFVAYLFYRQAPHWVRHYVRNLEPRLEEDASYHSFTPGDFGLRMCSKRIGFALTLLRQKTSDELLIA